MEEGSMKYATALLAATMVAVYMIGTLPMWASDVLADMAGRI